MYFVEFRLDWVKINDENNKNLKNLFQLIFKQFIIPGDK